jgi:hypothetical protein
MDALEGIDEEMSTFSKHLWKVRILPTSRPHLYNNGRSSRRCVRSEGTDTITYTSNSIVHICAIYLLQNRREIHSWIFRNLASSTLVLQSVLLKYTNSTTNTSPSAIATPVHRPHRPQSSPNVVPKLIGIAMT